MMGGLILHSNLRMMHRHGASLFSRSLHPLLLSSTPPSLLPHRFRSCICLKEVGPHHKSQTALIRTFSSCGSQEVNLSSEEMAKNKFLVDCEIDQECITGGIVALGKFDALHIGHRELAIKASKAGPPFLLSFVGIAEVLGWEPRPPVVAKCDRKRILSSWAPYCGDLVPLELQVDFRNVRHLTPQQFVEKLSKELRVGGVVAGENYRFGYKASGDASELVRLSKEYGFDAYIVKHVMDSTQQSCNGGVQSKDVGQVSSTRVRYALSMGDMEYVAQLLGRKHRLVLTMNRECNYSGNKRISVPKSCMLNLPPKDGEYNSCTLVLDDEIVGPCRVAIDAEKLDIELRGESLPVYDLINECGHIGVEFH